MKNINELKYSNDNKNMQISPNEMYAEPHDR